MEKMCRTEARSWATTTISLKSNVMQVHASFISCHPHRKCHKNPSSPWQIERELHFDDLHFALVWATKTKHIKNGQLQRYLGGLNFWSDYFISVHVFVSSCSINFRRSLGHQYEFRWSSADADSDPDRNKELL
eukprot:6393831-Amphidinium_carterae.1